MFYVRKFCREAAFGLTLCMPGLPALAQSAPSSVDPMTLQVAGVSLGMSVADSVAGLQKFDPSFKIEKLYQNSDINQFAVPGTPMNNIPVSSQNDQTLPQKYAFFTELTATDGANTVNVWYNPVPGQEKVIAVLRQEQYKPVLNFLEQEDPELYEAMQQGQRQYGALAQNAPEKAPQLPALSAIKAGIAAKYPYPYTLYDPHVDLR